MCLGGEEGGKGRNGKRRTSARFGVPVSARGVGGTVVVDAAGEEVGCAEGLSEARGRGVDGEHFFVVGFMKGYGWNWWRRL